MIQYIILGIIAVLCLVYVLRGIVSLFKSKESSCSCGGCGGYQCKDANCESKEEK